MCSGFALSVLVQLGSVTVGTKAKLPIEDFLSGPAHSATLNVNERAVGSSVRRDDFPRLHLSSCRAEFRRHCRSHRHGHAIRPASRRTIVGRVGADRVARRCRTSSSPGRAQSPRLSSPAICSTSVTTPSSSSLSSSLPTASAPCPRLSRDSYAVTACGRLFDGRELMAVYIALLRGVNVGQNTLKMERLRGLCADLGLMNVRTYLQSGNVVFQAQASASHWAQALEQKLIGESRLPVFVIVRTAAEMAKVEAGNPFLKEKGIDTARLGRQFSAATSGEGRPRCSPRSQNRLRAVPSRRQRDLSALSRRIRQRQAVYPRQSALAKDHNAQLEHGQEASRNVRRVSSLNQRPMDDLRQP